MGGVAYIWIAQEERDLAKPLICKSCRALKRGKAIKKTIHLYKALCGSPVHRHRERQSISLEGPAPKRRPKGEDHYELSVRLASGLPDYTGNVRNRNKIVPGGETRRLMVARDWTLVVYSDSWKINEVRRPLGATNEVGSHLWSKNCGGNETLHPY